MTTAGIQTFIQSWQAQHVLSTTASNACLEEKEPPNAVVLCINLQNLPLKDTAEWVQHATEDEVKAHKGLRTTLFVTKIIYAGFTFVPPPAGADKSVRGERLAILDGDSELEKRSILFYNYKGEQNKKLDTYVKTKRFDDCTSVSQGMVITGSIWANKLQNMLKKNKEFDNIGVFELCLVQLGIKSFMSKAADTGMMLEIKSVTPLRTMSLSQHQQMVPHTLPPRSVQESVEFRNKFMDGLFVSEDKRKHLKQELIKGNYSTSTHLVALTPTSEHGIVAISADGKLKFFQRQPIGDIHATTMELSYDLPFHWGGDSAHKQEEDPVEWMAKLFNVAMMMGALELFVVADEYRMRGGGANRGGGNPPQQSVQDAPAPSLDIHLQAYARVNEKQILSRIVALDTPVLLQAVATEEEEICTYIAAQGVDIKHLVIFQRCAKTLDLVVDLRRMTNNKKPSAHTNPALSTLVHSSAPWLKGHMLHAFYEKKCVLSLVVSLSDIQKGADGGAYKRALEPVQLAKCVDVTYDDDHDQDEDEGLAMEQHVDGAPPPPPATASAIKSAETASAKPARKKTKMTQPQASTTETSSP